MSSSPNRAELGVRGTSVLSRTWTKHISLLLPTLSKLAIPIEWHWPSKSRYRVLGRVTLRHVKDPSSFQRRCRLEPNPPNIGYFAVPTVIVKHDWCSIHKQTNKDRRPSIEGLHTLSPAWRWDVGMRRVTEQNNLWVETRRPSIRAFPPTHATWVRPNSDSQSVRAHT